MQDWTVHEKPIYGHSQEGVMQLAGHDVRDLLATFGSPLVVMLEETLRANCRSYKQQIEEYPRSR
ncbi:MAG: hypothetical protein AAGJ35_08695, partial [Myxococcota bacterium]